MTWTPEQMEGLLKKGVKRTKLKRYLIPTDEPKQAKLPKGSLGKEERRLTIKKEDSLKELCKMLNEMVGEELACRHLRRAEERAGKRSRFLARVRCLDCKRILEYYQEVKRVGDGKCIRCGRAFTIPNLENEYNFCCICLRDMKYEEKYGKNWRREALKGGGEKK